MKLKVSSIQPLFDRLLVKREESETVSTGGIIIPETAKDKLNRGVVIAVGGGLTDVPIEAKVGDVVLFTQYAGIDIEVEEAGEFLMVRNTDVLAVIE